MKRQKTEAWLVEANGERRLTFLSKLKVGEMFAGTQVKRITPLVRRDPKAEAVLRAAVKWRTGLVGVVGLPRETTINDARMALAVDQLLAAKKRRAKR